MNRWGLPAARIKEVFLNRTFLIRLLASLLIAVVAVFGLIQLVPYGRDHTNSPVVNEPAWDSPQTREYAVRACYDCHSNEADWPWYSNIAPASWLVQRGVDGARDALNFSDWESPVEDGGEIVEEVAGGYMPLCDYLWTHPTAKLSLEEQRQFVRGLQIVLDLPVRELEIHQSGKGFFRCAQQQLLPVRRHHLPILFGIALVGSAAVLGAGFWFYRRQT